MSTSKIAAIWWKKIHTPLLRRPLGCVMDFFSFVGTIWLDLFNIFFANSHVQKIQLHQLAHPIAEYKNANQHFASKQLFHILHVRSVILRYSTCSQYNVLFRCFVETSLARSAKTITCLNQLLCSRGSIFIL